MQKVDPGQYNENPHQLKKRPADPDAVTASKDDISATG
jgi:hypothetical protein